MAFSCPRGGLSISRQALRHCKSSPGLQPSFLSARQFSRSIIRRDESQTQATEPPSSNLPRWAHTPDRMKAPFSLSIAKNPERQIWAVNEDPEKLDQVYRNLLGHNGEKLLPEELKWLAVTHKSFDQGRRGFNTRLAHFGRHILVLELTRSIMASPAYAANESEQPETKDDSRWPFEHPALARVDKLTNALPQDVISQEKISKFALDQGLADVVRWKPRNPQSMKGSGQNGVLQGTIYAILGAISLQHGAAVASKICRERILRRLPE